MNRLHKTEKNQIFALNDLRYVIFAIPCKNFTLAAEQRRRVQ